MISYVEHFFIDPDFLTTKTVVTERDLPGETSEDRLRRYLEGRRYITTTSEDHPEFQNLRNLLEKLGYILTQRTYHNGDLVLKDFFLNRALFKKGETFYSPHPLKFTIDQKLKGKGQWIKTL
jgi:hypothetical protein